MVLASTHFEPIFAYNLNRYSTWSRHLRWFIFQASDDETDDKRVVRSEKEKRYESLYNIIKNIKNSKKIKDFNKMLSRYFLMFFCKMNGCLHILTFTKDILSLPFANRSILFIDVSVSYFNLVLRSYWRLMTRLAELLAKKRKELFPDFISGQQSTDIDVSDY